MKTCGKNCEHYCSGMCFKIAEAVKLVKEGEPCKQEATK